jgi:hypothetical protein
MGLLGQPLLPVLLLACIFSNQCQQARCQSLLGTFAEVRKAYREQLRLAVELLQGNCFTVQLHIICSCACLVA